MLILLNEPRVERLKRYSVIFVLRSSNDGTIFYTLELALRYIFGLSAVTVKISFQTRANFLNCTIPTPPIRAKGISISNHQLPIVCSARLQEAAPLSPLDLAPVLLRTNARSDTQKAFLDHVYYLVLSLFSSTAIETTFETIWTLKVDHLTVCLTECCFVAGLLLP